MKQEKLVKEIDLDVYQVIRLRHALKKPTQEILKENYLNFYLGPVSGIPVVSLVFNDIKVTSLISGYLRAENNWQSKQGSDTFIDIMNWLVSKGYYASTKTNKSRKIQPKFNINNKILPFIGNILYNFNSFNTFSKDERVAKSIYDDKATEEDYIYVMQKVLNTLKGFTNMLDKNNITDFEFDGFRNAMLKGGEI